MGRLSSFFIVEQMRMLSFSEPCDVDLNLDFSRDQEWQEGHNQNGHNYRFAVMQYFGINFFH